MAHDFLRELDDDAGAGGGRIAVALTGGALLVASFAAQGLFRGPEQPAMLALAAAVLLGLPLAARAVDDLRSGRAEMNELAALGWLASLATGEYAAAGAIAFFMILSIVIEQRSAHGARRSIEALIRMTPRRARRILPDASEEDVAADALRPGDVVRVRPGDAVPGDGRVVRGRSEIDESAITGESVPADRVPGDTVFGGTISVSGTVDVEVAASGADTTLSRVRDQILTAERTRPAVARVIDRYAAWYAPVIVLAAAVVLFATRDMSRAIALLVVACPCPIVLAGPSAVVAALGAAARLGVLVKDAADLETARRVTAVVFDKTGTLTRARLAVAALAPAPGTTGDDLLACAAAATSGSRHPVARAIASAVRERALRVPDAADFREDAGCGVTATTAVGVVRAGRAQWLRATGCTIDEPADADAGGLSLVHVVRDGLHVGWIGLADEVRPDAGDAVSRLRTTHGVRVEILTGDRAPAASRVARDVGADHWTADALPGDKLAAVERLRAAGHVVAVVGDGVNDAPALAAADVSVAIGAAGSDVALRSARIALLHAQLDRVPFLIGLSRRTIAILRQNLVIAATLIALLAAASAMGFVPPVLAVILHTAISLAVVVNSARLVREGESLLPAHAQESAS